MSIQSELIFASDATIAPSSSTGTLRERFESFHAANPHVYAALVVLARRLTARGRTRIGIAQLFEVLRYEWDVQTSDTASAFKMNNSYRSFYAREIAQREPDLASVFETRSMLSERAA